MLETDKMAPSGQFRVIGKDNPSDQGWYNGDYDTEAEATKIAVDAVDAKRSFVRFKVFNDRGECIHG